MTDYRVDEDKYKGSRSKGKDKRSVKKERQKNKIDPYLIDEDFDLDTDFTNPDR